MHLTLSIAEKSENCFGEILNVFLIVELSVHKIVLDLQAYSCECQFSFAIRASSGINFPISLA